MWELGRQGLRGAYKQLWTQPLYRQTQSHSLQGGDEEGEGMRAIWGAEPGTSECAQAQGCTG